MSHWNAAVAARFAAIRRECNIVAKVNIHIADLCVFAAKIRFGSTPSDAACWKDAGHLGYLIKGARGCWQAAWTSRGALVSRCLLGPSYSEGGLRKSRDRANPVP